MANSGRYFCRSSGRWVGFPQVIDLRNKIMQIYEGVKPGGHVCEQDATRSDGVLFVLRSLGA